MRYGLIGERLGHSYSKEIHGRIARYDYELREIAREALPEFLMKREFLGINVTIPYKEAVMPFLDEISENARLIGSVNTIVCRNGRLSGYNTDLSGMIAMLRHAGIGLCGRRVMILGTGGTSKTARAAAKKLGAARVTVVSRQGREGGISYEEARRQSDTQILINTTPVGMYPHTEEQPVTLDSFPELAGVADVIYNPLRTELIQEAAARGIPCTGGLYMLAAQAEYARSLFLGEEADETLIERAYEGTLAEKRSIVLIGMPSSGKSTVGARLSEKLGRPLLDTDGLVRERAGMSIPEIFRTRGEEAFREMETEAIGGIADIGGRIIATGGGAVLREENLRALKKNGVLVFLDRPLEALCGTQDRPLAQDARAMEKLYGERYARYLAAADLRIEGNDPPDAIADRIMKELKL